MKCKQIARVFETKKETRDLFCGSYQWPMGQVFAQIISKAIKILQNKLIFILHLKI